ncbi:unnamed protein product [Caenorhabditis nigoni]
MMTVFGDYTLVSEIMSLPDRTRPLESVLDVLNTRKFDRDLTNSGVDHLVFKTNGLEVGDQTPDSQLGHLIFVIFDSGSHLEHMTGT